MIKENAKYYLIPKNCLFTVSLWAIIMCFFGLAWMFYQEPKEFRNGIYPEVRKIYAKQEVIEAGLNERIDIIETMINQSPYLFQISPH